jgi:chromate transporter
MSETEKRPSVADLFVGFFVVGVMGFGGVLASSRRMVVEQRGWLTATEFTGLLGLCQFLPGGNIMNLSVALGARFRGIPGAVAALVGLMSGPVAIVIGLGVIYDQYKDVPAVVSAFAYLSAAAAAFMVATALRIAAPLWGKLLGIGMAVVTFLVIAVLGWPLVLALPVLALISVALAWVLPPREQA